MTVFQFNSITRATSGPGVNPAAVAAIFAVLGVASTEPASGPGADGSPEMFSTDAEPEDDFGYGPMPETAAIISSYSGMATVGVRLDEAAPGDYGTIDNTGFTGTAVPLEDSTVVPVNDHEVYLRFDTGGTLGTAGIRYSVSLDGGRTFIQERTPLGTSDTITITRANASIVLHPPSAQVTALVSLVNDARTQTIAHLAEGSTVHLTADVVSGASIGSAATNEATAIARVNQLRTALIAHAAFLTVHTAADAVSFASLPAAATDGPSAIALAIAIKAALNAHLALTGSVHGSLPATGDVAAADPANGTVVANDVIEITTLAPTWDSTGLANALGEAGDLTTYTTPFGGIVIRGRFPIAAWTTLINGLNYLRARQRPIGMCIIEARLPNDGETAAEYLDSLETEWAGKYDERVHIVTGDGRYDPVTIAKCRHQDRRLHTAPLAARLAALDYAESPGVVATSAKRYGVPSVFGGPLDGYRIRDDNGVLFGIDAFEDGHAQAAAGFGCVGWIPNKPETRCWVASPAMRAPLGSTAPHPAHQRIAAVIELALYLRGTELIQQHPVLEAGSTTIRADAADHIDAAVYAYVIGIVGDPAKGPSPRISSFTFAVDRTADISVDPVVLPWTATVRTGAYIARLSGVFSVNGGT